MVAPHLLLIMWFDGLLFGFQLLKIITALYHIVLYSISLCRRVELYKKLKDRIQLACKTVQRINQLTFVQYPRKTFSSSSSMTTVAAARPVRFFSLSRELSRMCWRTPTRMSICVHSRRSPSIDWRMRASGAAPTYTVSHTTLPPPIIFTVVVRIQ